MAKEVVIDICAICREEKKMTFEHSPPRAAFNNKFVRMQDHRHLIPTEEHKYLYGKSKTSRRGLGNYTLCETCNNFVGANYSQSYIGLAHKFNPFPSDGKRFIRMSTDLMPLNFFKQVLTILLCADRFLGAINNIIGKDYILEKENNSLNNSARIFMYATNSKSHRMIGLSGIYLNGITGNYAECNFHPFGFLFSNESKKLHQSLFDISEFSNYNFNEKAIIDFNLPVFDVKGLTLGSYEW